MTRDEYVRQAADRLAELRRPTVAGDIDIPDEVVTAAAEAIEDAAIRRIGRDLGTIHRDDIVRAGLAAAVPLLRARWEAEQRDAFNAQVRDALRQLDGTTASAVALLTGMTRDEIDQVGGVTPECREARAEQVGGGDE